MLKLIHRLLIHTAMKAEDPEEQFADGFDGIPSASKTVAMSARALASELRMTKEGGQTSD